MGRVIQRWVAGKGNDRIADCRNDQKRDTETDHWIVSLLVGERNG